MKIKLDNFKIDESNPFQNDLFERKTFADKLQNVVKNNKDKLVICLNGEWGVGKTTFLKMWEKQLDIDHIPNLYLDAFENDYTEDAFFFIASAIDELVQKSSIQENKKEELLEKSKQVAKKLLIWSGKIGLKALTLNIIDESEIEALKGMKDDLADSFSKKFEEYAEEQFFKFQSDKNLFLEYRTLLAEVAEEISQDDVPLVVIIDELDRCKPSFAVDVLEKIKHFFSVDNVVFLLSINKNQLEHSIKAEYGIGIDANTYLQKFIDIYMTLPTKSNYGLTTNIENYVKKLFKEYDLDRIFNYYHNENYEYLKAFTSALSIHNDLSFRQIEKIILNVKILVSSKDISGINHTEMILLGYISYLIVLHPEVINRLRTNNITANELLDMKDIKIELGDLNKVKHRINFDNLKKFLLFSFYKKPEDFEKNKDSENFFNQTFSLRNENNNPLIALLDTLQTFNAIDF